MIGERPRTVIVTGGASGIGRAIAEAFAAGGSTVYALGRTPEEIERAVPFCSGIRPLAVDVTQDSAIARLFAAVTGDRLDVHTKIDMCRRHFEQTGLGADFVRQFVR